MSFDDAKDNQAFAEKHEFPFSLLCDTTREVGVAYRAAADKDAGHPSRISYLIGKDGTILKAYPKVSPATHPNQVLEDLAAINKGPTTEPKS